MIASLKIFSLDSSSSCYTTKLYRVYILIGRIIFSYSELDRGFLQLLEVIFISIWLSKYLYTVYRNSTRLAVIESFILVS